MKDDRYQNQNLITRIFRWLRWRPVYFIKASLYVLETFFDKKILWDYEEKAYFRRSFMFNLIADEASSKMKHYYDMDEVFNRIKS